MPIIRRDFKRKSGYRDAKLIVIATEGENTEQVYFDGLKTEFANPAIHVKILERTAAGSSPQHVQEELDNFHSGYHLVEGDELWMVIDRDRWPDKNLADIAARCGQKGYQLALSVPCFELWLLLHVEDVSAKDVDGLSCKQLGAGIRKVIGAYNKNKPDMTVFAPNVKVAIERAIALDTNPEDRWPQTPGTRVYLLANSLMAATDERK